MSDYTIEVYIVDGLADGPELYPVDQVDLLMDAIQTSLEYFDSGIKEINLSIRKMTMSEEAYSNLPQDH